MPAVDCGVNGVAASAQSAIPFWAFTVAVPTRVVKSIETVTAADESVTRFPETSCTVITGWVAKATRFTKPVGAVVSASLLAAPGNKDTD